MYLYIQLKATVTKDNRQMTKIEKLPNNVQKYQIFDYYFLI